MSEQGRKHQHRARRRGGVRPRARPASGAALFIGPLNSHTGIGYATISLAFGVAQLMWGVAQPLAGAVDDAEVQKLALPKD